MPWFVIAGAGLAILIWWPEPGSDLDFLADLQWLRVCLGILLIIGGLSGSGLFSQTPEAPVIQTPSEPFVPAPVPATDDDGPGLIPGPASGGDVDCDQVSGPVLITGDDPNGLDADNDGIGCE